MTEPLAPLARFAFDWAETLCDANHRCAPYHKMWSMVRLVESDGALPAGQPFFARQAMECARGGNVHVLLSGGADTGIMALAVEEPLRKGVSVRITAVDRCRTPLEQMRLYGAAMGVPVDQFACTLDQIPAGIDADAIFGHSILSFIPDEARSAVFTAWAGALRPGGRVVLSQRLTPVNDTYQRRRPPKDIEDRRQTLAAQLDELGDLPAVASKDELLGAAVDFWQVGIAGHDVTEAQIRDHSAAAGLIVRQVEEAPAAASVSPFMLASQAVRRPRYEIVLERPDN
ncbi:class I SAM-dependent methyltransferase [Marivivens marinus]|uniref:class I SAM-dependent methyltransferase n=1 Tax=Marivivens marinus TaxID=3110173 RepID=UPI003B8470A3